MRPAEPRLDYPWGPRFLPDPLPQQLKEWWLKRPLRANTPNWDLVSTCKIAGRDGLLLIEAKAHDRETQDLQQVHLQVLTGNYRRGHKSLVT